MKKSYREIKNEYNYNRLISIAFFLSAISDFAHGSVGLGVTMSAIDLIKIIDTVREYKNFDDCKEFNELKEIYNKVVSDLINCMDGLDITTLGEKYAFFRYILENNTLRWNLSCETKNSKIRRKETIERPLILNNHGLKKSSALLLKDLLNQTGNMATIINGKIIDEDTKINEKETNNFVANKIINIRKPSLAEKARILIKPIKHLIYTEEDECGYFLNPDDTEVFASTNEDGYLISNKGTLFKESKSFSGSTICGQSEYLLDYKEFVLERIASAKPTMYKLEESLIDELIDADNIYKRLI